jgi:hypothetical protein
MASAPARFVLIISGYAPLLVVLAARFWSASKMASILLVLAAAASILVLSIYIRQLHRMQGKEIALMASGPAASELLGHISAYVFPFLEVDFGDTADLVSLGLVYAVLIFIQVKTNLIHINPSLYLLRYHVFQAQDESGREYALISRRDYISPKSSVRVVRAGNHVILERRCPPGHPSRT